MLLTGLVVLLFVLIVAPAAAAAVVWARRRPAQPFPLAAAGAALMLLSFILLPWLSFDPLRYVGLDWLYETVPLARALLGRLVGDNLSGLLPLWRVAGVFVHPPGWLALALGVGPLTWFVVLLLGGVAFAAAQAVTWWPRHRLPAWVLAAAAAALLLLLLYDLAAIDGLGEHSFPHPLAVAQPFLAAHINPIGPLATAVALGLMVGGAAQALGGASAAADDDEQEWR